MKYYIFEGLISNDELQVTNLISFIQETEGDLTIALCSEGGDAALSRVLLRMLNEHSERITLIAYELVGSAAFNVFYEFEGEKKIAFCTNGLYHHTTVDINVAGGNRATYYLGLAHQETMDTYWKNTINRAEGFLTVPEMMLLKTHQDVALSFSRMIEIFPDAEII